MSPIVRRNGASRSECYKIIGSDADQLNHLNFTVDTATISHFYHLYHPPLFFVNMSGLLNKNEAQASAPAPAPTPPAPPLPPASKNNDPMSKFALKIKNAPPGWFYRSPKPPRPVDYFEPRTGPYFLYGTLADLNMLRDILSLDHEPILRPANVVGYTCKLWGQYPAIIDGEMGATINGAVYIVKSVKDARRLADYETENYETKPCKINYTDGKEPQIQHGQLFMFAGNTGDLEDGNFDLSVWLKRVGR